MTKKKTTTNEGSKKVYRAISHLVKKDSPLYQYLYGLLLASNNLYNATNFHIRQLYTALTADKELHSLQKEILDSFEKTIPLINKHLRDKRDACIKKDLESGVVKDHKLKVYEMPKAFPSYYLMDAYFKYTKNADYLAMPGQVNQQTIKQVYLAWTSFFESLKKYKTNPNSYTGHPKPPRYKAKSGFNEVTFSNQVCTIKDGKYIRFPKTNLTFNLSKHLNMKINDGQVLQQVRVQKYYDTIKLEIVLDCKNSEKPLKESIVNVCSVDIGVNNILTSTFSNGKQPIIINGRPLKSMNQYYNKLRAKLYSDLRINKKPNEGNFTSKRLEFIDKKRHLKFKDFMHKVSKTFVDIVIANDIDKVIIGYNKGWKIDTAMQLKTKQTFIQIPFTILLNQLEYKLRQNGIHFELKEESYTSMASFLDGDEIPTYGDSNITKDCFSGKRIKRGLYRTKNNTLINSDVNGAANILRKHFDGHINLDHKILSNVKKINIKVARTKLKKETHKALGIVSRNANCVAC